MIGRRRIWITGIGLVTAIGTGVDPFRAGKAVDKDEFDSLGLGTHRETHRWADAFSKAPPA